MIGWIEVPTSRKTASAEVAILVDVESMFSSLKATDIPTDPYSAWLRNKLQDSVDLVPTSLIGNQSDCLKYLSLVVEVNLNLRKC